MDRLISAARMDKMTPGKYPLQWQLAVYLCKDYEVYDPLQRILEALDAALIPTVSALKFDGTQRKRLRDASEGLIQMLVIFRSLQVQDLEGSTLQSKAFQQYLERAFDHVTQKWQDVMKWMLYLLSAGVRAVDAGMDFVIACGYHCPQLLPPHTRASSAVASQRTYFTHIHSSAVAKLRNLWCSVQTREDYLKLLHHFANLTLPPTREDMYETGKFVPNDASEWHAWRDSVVWTWDALHRTALDVRCLLLPLESAMDLLRGTWKGRIEEMARLVQQDPGLVLAQAYFQFNYTTTALTIAILRYSPDAPEGRRYSVVTNNWGPTWPANGRTRFKWVAVTNGGTSHLREPSGCMFAVHIAIGSIVSSAQRTVLSCEATHLVLLDVKTSQLGYVFANMGQVPVLDFRAIVILEGEFEFCKTWHRCIAEQPSVTRVRPVKVVQPKGMDVGEVVRYIATRRALVGINAQASEVDGDVSSFRKSGKDIEEQAGRADCMDYLELCDRGTAPPAAAERLKQVGNQLYQQKKYNEALDKYTDALEQDKRNAIIYANRAAVHLARKEHIDAIFDCERATSIDPTYAKAWGRLGTSLYLSNMGELCSRQAISSWDECINAWQKALECLSKPTLNQSELSLKTQIEQGLKMAKQGSVQNAESQKLAPVLRAPDPAFLEAAGAPWNRANSLKDKKEEDLIKSQSLDNLRPPSCTSGLWYADYYYKDAMTRLSALFLPPLNPNSPSVGGGMPGFFDCMTIAILCDERVFRLANPQFTYGRIFRQYEFESIMSNGLVEGGGLHNIKKVILSRLKEQGWEKVQPAITLTVRVNDRLSDLGFKTRYWIFQAFWRYYMYGPSFLSYQLYTRALEFIEWGRSQWPDVPEEKCGQCFKKELVRGLKRLRIQQMQMLLDTKQPDDVDHLFNAIDLGKAAHRLLEDIEAHNIDDLPQGDKALPVGHLLAFWINTSIQAHSTIGWCYGSLAQSISAMAQAKAPADRGPDREIVHSHHSNAAYHYKTAARLCPDDEAYRPLLLRKHLQCLCFGFRPAREFLPVCEAIRLATPNPLEIWTPPDERGKAIVNNYAQVQQFEQWCKDEVKAGRMNLDKAEKLIMPMEFVYTGLAGVERPFQPIMFTRAREGGVLTDRRIFFDPIRPPSPELAGPSSKVVPRRPTDPPEVFHWFPIIGSAIQYGNNPIGFFTECRNKYGDIFTFVLLGKRITVALGPKGNNFILGGKSIVFNAEDAYTSFTTPVFGKDVVYDVPNEKFMEQKRFVKVGLSTDNLRAYVRMIEEEVLDYINNDPVFQISRAKKDTGGWAHFDAVKVLQEIIILTASRTLQGKEVRENMDKTFAELYRDLDGGFTPIVWMFPNAPLERCRKRDRAQKKMSEFYIDIIKKRREELAKGLEGEHDMISALLDQSYRSGEQLKDHEIAHMMITLLMAGQHTSSATSAWAILHVANNPSIADALHKEQLQNFGTPDGKMRPPTFESLRSLPILDAVIRETLRMHPPIHSIMRHVREDVAVPVLTFADSSQTSSTHYVIPKGHYVMASPAVSQIDKDIWKHADQWDPLRWLSDPDGVAEKAYKTYVDEDGEKMDYGFGAVSKGTESPYQPFGAGRHRCIGEQFAYMQLGTIIAMLVRQLEMRIEVMPEPDYHVSPRHTGVPLVILNDQIDYDNYAQGTTQYLIQTSLILVERLMTPKYLVPDRVDIYDDVQPARFPSSRERPLSDVPLLCRAANTSSTHTFDSLFPPALPLPLTHLSQPSAGNCPRGRADDRPEVSQKSIRVTEATIYGFMEDPIRGSILGGFPKLEGVNRRSWLRPYLCAHPRFTQPHCFASMENNQLEDASSSAAAPPPVVNGPPRGWTEIKLRNDQAAAERLKNIGNELFQQKKYDEALDKYTEALEQDTRNAIIYANRAAVHLARKEHIDAVFDCERATSIDPTYAKAWGRLGTALYVRQFPHVDSIHYLATAI
ncbi:hypothetical protein NMY22_g14283 [Coprinellus aureogranulatus]|nr:hypothetical protein NMY22_g14283 [Coprinellus aureogranulatus]